METEMIIIIIGVILGVYEVIARVIPSVGDLSWLSWIIKLLKWISDSLNRRK